MNATMRRLSKTVIACLLVAALLSGPTALAAGLLDAMIDIALRADRTIEVVYRVEGEALYEAMESVLTAPELGPLAGVSKLLNGGQLRLRYTGTDEGDAFYAAVELGGETLIWLDVRVYEKQLMLVTSLLEDTTLLMRRDAVAKTIAEQNPMMQDEALMNALSASADRYGKVISDWVTTLPTGMTMFEVPTDPTPTRDAISSSFTFKLDDTALYALLDNLVNEFATDTELIKALAPQANMDPLVLIDVVKQLAQALGSPQGNGVDIEVSTGAESALIGVDVTAASGEDAPMDVLGKVVYSHKTGDDGFAIDTYEGLFTMDGQQVITANFAYSGTETNELLDNHNTYVGELSFQSPQSELMELRVDGDIYERVEPITESYKHTLSAEAKITNGDQPNPMQFQADVTIQSETNVIETDDFLHVGTLTANVMGMELIGRTVIESKQYNPSKYSYNTVVQLDELSPGEMDALMQEMQATAQALLDSLQPERPPEPTLLAYTIENEQIPSIEAIVGPRAMTDIKGGFIAGVPYVKVFYQSETVQEDIETYLNEVRARQCVFIGREGDYPKGAVQYARESVFGDKLFIVTIDFNLDTYSVLIYRIGGELERFTNDDGLESGRITLEDAEPATTVAKGDPDIMVRGFTAVEEGAGEEALSIFEEALAADPDIADYHHGRGQAMITLGRYDEAMESIVTAIKIDPNNSDYINARGVAYYYMEETDHAMVDWKKAIQMGAFDPDPYSNLGFVQSEMGLLNDALLTYIEGAEVFPENNEFLLLNIGDIHFLLEHYSEALAAYDQAIAYGNYAVDDIPNYALSQEALSE